MEVPFTNAPSQHASLMQNFVESIREGKALIAPGQDGIGSVELANAILYSSLTQSTVDLPLNSATYERKLNELIATSRFEKKVESLGNDDFSKSFRR